MTEAIHTEEGELPDFLDLADICRVSQFSPHIVRKHFRRLNLVERIGGRLYVSKYDLRDQVPRIYRVIVVKFLEGKLQQPERKKRTPPQKQKSQKRTKGTTTQDQPHAAA